MAASIPLQVVTKAGITPASLQAATGGGDTMAPGPSNYLIVANGDSSPHTVTVTRVTPCSDGDSSPLHDIVVVVVNGTTRWIAVDARYGRTSDGLAAVTYSAATAVTVGAVQA
jgi:hypothetical protein